MSITKDIEKIISDRKTHAEMTADQNLREVLENPEIAQLYEKCNTLKYEIAKSQFENKDSKSLIDSYKTTRNDLHSLIKKHAYNIQSLKPKYTCNICKDTGINNDKHCVCYNTLLNNYLLKSSGINHKLPTFKNINYSIYDKENVQKIQDIVKILQDIVKKYPHTNKKMFNMIGNVGVGKTYITECFVDLAIKKGLYTVYTTAQNLNNELLSYYLAPLSEKKEIIEKYLDSDILCIDDLGTENILKNVTIEYLYMIINERLNNNKFTLITSNLSPKQVIDTYDERIFSRMIDKEKCITVSLSGSDLRLKNYI